MWKALSQGSGFIRFKAGNDIFHSNSHVTTNGGDVVYWSDSDVDGVNFGAVDVQGNTITSNGGDVIMAGGLDDGSNGGMAGDNIPDGFAHGENTSYRGVYLPNTDITSGAGNIIMRGEGHNTGVGNDFRFGVQISGGSQITTTTGNIDITGQGGDAGISNYGVAFFTAGTEISTADGAIAITGTGGVGGDTQTGVRIGNGVDVKATNNGFIQITGTGGNEVTGSSHHGVSIGSTAISDTNEISVVNGNLSITGNAGNGVNTNPGVRLFEDTVILSSGTGNISITGTGNGTGVSNNGIDLRDDSQIDSQSSGSITITGTSALDGKGILMRNMASVAATSGNITMTGIANPGFLDLDTNGSGTSVGKAGMTGNITMNADRIDFANDTKFTMNTQGDIYITPRTVGRSIDIGGNVGGGMQLTQAELDTIKSAGNLIIGDTTNTANFTVSNTIDFSTLASNISLIGDSVALSDSLTTEATKTLSITADNGAITRSAGTLTANTINLNATATIAADINAENVDIGSGGTDTTLTGMVTGMANQNAADRITGGPGNDDHYTFEGFTIRLSTARDTATISEANANAAEDTMTDIFDDNEQPIAAIDATNIPAPIVETAPALPETLASDVPNTVKVISQSSQQQVTQEVSLQQQDDFERPQQHTDPIIILPNESQGDIYKMNAGKVVIHPIIVEELGLDSSKLF